MGAAEDAARARRSARCPGRLEAPLALTSAALLLSFVGAAGQVAAAEAAASCGPAAADRPAPPVISCQRGPTRALAGPAPAGWSGQAFDDSRWAVASGLVAARGPALADMLGDPASRPTALEAAPGASLFLRRRFDLVADQAARLLELPRTIELRVGYLDGFMAYLNGAEIARRNLPEPGGAGRPPLPHGHEAERIFVPVTPATLLRSRDNVVAIEIRPARGRRGPESGAPAASVDVTVTSAVRIVRGPYLIAPVEGTMTVAWETDLPATGTVELQLESTTGGAAASASTPSPATSIIRTRAASPALRQTVRLSGLRAGATYQYRVIVDDAPPEAPSAAPWATSAWASFATPPAATAPLRFIVYGDMRAPGHAAHAQVVAGIVKERPALVLCTGDLVAVGSEESAWQKYFEITAPLGAIAPVVSSFGNHESYWHGAGLAKAWALFGIEPAGPKPGYASFDWGGAHFVVLDTNHLDGAQRDWLARDLEAAKQKHPRAMFAICHEGPWSHGVHGNSRTMQRDLAPLLAEAGVDVLFSGHDHLYERGVGTTPRGSLPYVVVGGGGAPLYEPSCQAGGAPGALPRCPPSVASIVKAYHYVVVEVGARTLRLCPKLPDGSALEPCVETPLRHGSSKSR